MKVLVLIVCAFIFTDAASVPKWRQKRSMKFSHWPIASGKNWFPDDGTGGTGDGSYPGGLPGGDGSYPGGLPGGDGSYPGGLPGDGGGGWFPGATTTPAPISCEDVGGYCLYEANCNAEPGPQYVCETEGLVCCLPPVLPDSKCGVTKEVSTRIVHGSEAEHNRWPWQASLQTPSDFHFCGGSLIHEQWVVTAAHCLDGSEMKVVLGEHDRSIAQGPEVTVGVIKQILHEGYSEGAPYPNDIALLKLETPVQLTDEIRTACIPSAGESFTTEDNCWISGWGDTKDTGDETKLHELKKTITDNPTCANKWGAEYIIDTHICVGNGDKGACNGDSGGPLSCQKDKWYLAGATSWGYNGCQTEGYPNVYTRVSEYRDWITHNIRTN
ncbi:Plasminogen,Chymotrypsin-like protease CTRL-1,Chymotrypsin-like elastase family member 2B,Chymotrypsinogen 2,Chymotrypsinogen B2,Chymotrypsin-like elastase family member 2A,Transmembrane protease serine 11C,CUB and peptidase domain-containing protein 1,Trypsin,Anionic trypsin-2,Chymotrypsin-like elastase family member 3B,Anionic trypsin,Plasma kallikrein,Chymotrypsinogen B,Chymotrypsin A [Mytilus coruscus]|uniref:Peptidase S1 domain-containing protein n=1 Tax=Mytilus coruscus TaxID=42192 RepID=A0A6J8DZS1_MYTCO|nr:Plasminogen,Chymotrypsin-like protease CTRL-1,Chymotrypsin-like elastase family member 2B,Chymotrypsinogen 2,Chymotrypsinogen B2,Chymotrypsin-like elastase family member 2A,Transmembrane protease serine 11C,CUB and peptidase domain-containing protein 1,Trypsin,Anionic trypsin-2,Chymotrypsin-like elastase family member 3B,Anionic trypsin,Plasma kallikrein,Chymotrypsinogen B,Chymotrypsin A [Mytilus coruscus]